MPTSHYHFNPGRGEERKGKGEESTGGKKETMSRFSPRQKMLRKEKQGEKKIKNKSKQYRTRMKAAKLSGWDFHDAINMNGTSNMYIYTSM